MPPVPRPPRDPRPPPGRDPGTPLKVKRRVIFASLIHLIPDGVDSKIIVVYQDISLAPIGQKPENAK